METIEYHQSFLGVEHNYSTADGRAYITIHTDAGDAVIAVDELGEMIGAIEEALGE